MAKQLHYGELTVDLPDDADVTELAQEIENAARAGGGWVNVESTRKGGVAIFVTAGVPISLADQAGARVIV